MTTSPDVLRDSVQDSASGPETASVPASAPASDPGTPTATLGGDNKRSIEQIALLLFITVPFVAPVAAVPLAWGWG